MHWPCGWLLVALTACALVVVGGRRTASRWLGSQWLVLSGSQCVSYSVVLYFVHNLVVLQVHTDECPSGAAFYIQGQNTHATWQI